MSKPSKIFLHLTSHCESKYRNVSVRNFRHTALSGEVHGRGTTVRNCAGFETWRMFLVMRQSVSLKNVYIINSKDIESTLFLTAICLQFSLNCPFANYTHVQLHVSLCLSDVISVILDSLALQLPVSAA